MIGIEMSGDFFHPCFRPFQVLLIRGDREQSKALGQLEDVREDERARRLQSNRRDGGSYPSFLSVSVEWAAFQITWCQ